MALRYDPRRSLQKLSLEALPSGVRGPLLSEADLIILVGLRAGKLESWFEAPDWPRKNVCYVQIDETPRELWYALPSAEMAVESSKLVLQQLMYLYAVEKRAGGLPSVSRTRGFSLMPA